MVSTDYFLFQTLYKISKRFLYTPPLTCIYMYMYMHVCTSIMRNMKYMNRRSLNLAKVTCLLLSVFYLHVSHSLIVEWLFTETIAIFIIIRSIIISCTSGGNICN